MMGAFHSLTASNHLLFHHVCILMGEEIGHLCTQKQKDFQTLRLKMAAIRLRVCEGPP